jgi:hypothetical protein
LDPYPTTPLFVPFPSSDAPTPAPLASTQCRLAVCVAVWRNSLSVASTGPIFRQSEIVTFLTAASWHDGRRRCSIKTCRNDRKCDRKRLLDVIYTRVGVGGRVSPSSPAIQNPIACLHAPDVGLVETGHRRAPIRPQILRGARLRAVVVLLLDNPPPGETSDRVEAGHHHRPPRSNGSPIPSACWLSQCDGLHVPPLHPPLASVGHRTLRCLPHPPAPACQSRLPPLSADCCFLRSRAITVVVVTGRRICVNRHLPTPSCHPPPPPAPSLPIPSSSPVP